MADIQIDDTVDQNMNLADYTQRHLVWKSPDVGYAFFVVDSGLFYYKKTADAGATWGSRVGIHTASNNAINMAIWADWWTDGDSGELIHITYHVNSDNDTIHRSLNTDGDSLNTAVVVYGSGRPGGAGTNNNGCNTLCKLKSGRLVCLGRQREIGRYYHFESDDNGANWTSVDAPDADDNQSGSWANDLGGDESLVQACPLDRADTNDFAIVMVDNVDDLLEYSEWDDSGSSWSTAVQINDGTNNPAIVLDADSKNWPFAAMTRWSDGHVLVAAWNDADSSAADLDFWDITNTTTFDGSDKTGSSIDKIRTNDNEAGHIALTINQQNDAVYVAYNSGSTFHGSDDVKISSSTNDGDSWTQASYTETTDDLRAIGCDPSIGNNGGRIAFIVYNDDLADLMTNVVNSVEIAAQAVAATAPVLGRARFVPQLTRDVQRLRGFRNT